MRLSLTEIKAIIKSKNNSFGKSSKVYLFGSRVDDNKKGGDIDLYIIPENDINLFDMKIIGNLYSDSDSDDREYLILS